MDVNVYNGAKSLVIYFESRKSNVSKETTLGGSKLKVATPCTYL